MLTVLCREVSKVHQQTSLYVSPLPFRVASNSSSLGSPYITCILQCFVVDEEMYDSEERFAPKSLASTIEQTQQKYKKKKQVGIDPS